MATDVNKKVTLDTAYESCLNVSPCVSKLTRLHGHQEEWDLEKPGIAETIKTQSQGDLGPFSAGLPVSIPLWLAVNLKQRQKCRIVPPDWMDIDGLKDKKQEEADSRFFTDMPSPFYMEITQLLLQCATDDIPRADEVRTLIKDIWDLRLAKLRSSIDIFIKSGASHAKLNHLTLLEMNTVRQFLTKALDHMHRLKLSVSGDPSVQQ